MRVYSVLFTELFWYPGSLNTWNFPGESKVLVDSRHLQTQAAPGLGVKKNNNLFGLLWSKK